jgi:hypothetical protein
MIVHLVRQHVRIQTQPAPEYADQDALVLLVWWYMKAGVFHRPIVKLVLLRDKPTTHVHLVRQPVRIQTQPAPEYADQDALVLLVWWYMKAGVFHRPIVKLVLLRDKPTTHVHLVRQPVGIQTHPVHEYAGRDVPVQTVQWYTKADVYHRIIVQLAKLRDKPTMNVHPAGLLAATPILLVQRYVNLGVHVQMVL